MPRTAPRPARPAAAALVLLLLGAPARGGALELSASAAPAAVLDLARPGAPRPALGVALGLGERRTARLSWHGRLRVAYVPQGRNDEPRELRLAILAAPRFEAAGPRVTTFVGPTFGLQADYARADAATGPATHTLGSGFEAGIEAGLLVRVSAGLRVGPALEASVAASRACHLRRTRALPRCPIAVEVPAYLGLGVAAWF
jgi:hypothetical protein